MAVLRNRAYLARVAQEQRGVVDSALRRQDLSPRVRERLEMVKALALGQPVAEIVAWSGRSVRTVQRWLDRFASDAPGGVAALTDAPRAGRPPRADAAYLAALEAAVTTPPADLGLPFDVWTSDRLSAYLAEQTGVRLVPGWLRVLLARRDFACGRPKHTLKHLQEAEAVAACVVELAAAEAKSGRRARAVRTAL